MGEDEVRSELEADVAAGADLLRGLAERIGATAASSAVFGEPVEREGVTVIPVARASWGFGGGAGGEPPNEGLGGGGGSMVSPIGFIELRSGRAEFKRLRDPRKMAALGCAAAGALGLALWLGKDA